MQYASASKWLNERNITLDEGFCAALHEMALTFKKTIPAI